MIVDTNWIRKLLKSFCFPQNAPSRPCNAAALTAIIAEPGKIEEEFRDLPTATPTLDDIPAGAETKNRYANVIPIPDTRVLLTFQEDVPNSDYINANFVRVSGRKVIWSAMMNNGTLWLNCLIRPCTGTNGHVEGIHHYTRAIGRDSSWLLEDGLGAANKSYYDALRLFRGRHRKLAYYLSG